MISEFSTVSFRLRSFLLFGLFWWACPLLIEALGKDVPGARWGHTFVYDSIRDVALLFGGAPQRGSYLDDTWTWDGRVWKKHDVMGPSARGFAAAVFHEARGTVILHGGRGQGPKTNSDTWEWDGSDWRELEQEGPYASDHHQIVYVGHDASILAFGGWNGTDVSGETWFWNGAWKRVAVQNPPKRAAFAMAYDSQREKVILFGGLWIDGQYADVWEWKGGSWERRGEPYDNSSVDHHAMIYDGQRDQLIIFGGKNYRYQPLSNTHTLSGSRLRLLTAEGPTPRHSVGMTYDSRRGRVLLYGGKKYQGELQIALADLWSWDGKDWQLLPKQN